MKPCFILTILLLLEFSAFAQSIDSFLLANQCMENYENLLGKLHNLRLGQKQNTVEKAMDLLCEESPANPFKSLFENSKALDCELEEINALYKFYADCNEESYRRPIAEYFLVEFLLSKSKKAPELRNICVIKGSNGVFIMRYESSGEIVDKKCINNWQHRIVTLNFKNGKPYIINIRFPSPEELKLPCRQTSKPKEVINEPLVIEEEEKLIGGCETELVKLRNNIQLLKYDLASTQSRFIKIEAEIKKSQERILNLQKVINDKNDTISILTNNIKLEIIRYNSLTEKHSLFLAQQASYEESVSGTLQQLLSDLNTLNNKLVAHENKVQKTIEAYEQFDIASTNFLAINYGIVQAPYNLQISPEKISDPIKNSFKSADLSRNFGLCLFRPSIGFFLSNVRLNTNNSPSVTYSTFDFDTEKENLFLNNIPFEDIKYTHSAHNLNTLNLGFTLYVLEVLNIHKKKRAQNDTLNYINPDRTPQIPILNSLYFMLGASYVKGDIWHFYEGNYPGHFTKDSKTNSYILDKTKVNKTGMAVGITYLKPYFQFEIGYNTLYKDFIINLGSNLPLSRKSSNPKNTSENKHIARLKRDVNELKNNIRDSIHKLDAIQPNESSN